DEGLAYAAHENESELARQRLLVLSHDLEKLARFGQVAVEVGKPGRQLRRAQMPLDTRRISLRRKAEPFGETKGLRHADRDCLALQQGRGRAGSGPQRMAESVPEIEERAHPGLGFVLGDDARLHLAALGYGLDAGL